jgi:hypothetical protein
VEAVYASCMTPLMHAVTAHMSLRSTCISTGRDVTKQSTMLSCCGSTRFVIHRGKTASLEAENNRYFPSLSFSYAIILPEARRSYIPDAKPKLGRRLCRRIVVCCVKRREAHSSDSIPESQRLLYQAKSDDCGKLATHWQLGNHRLFPDRVVSVRFC